MLTLLDVTSAKSINWYFRKRRMKSFFSYLKTINKDKVNILDIGGTVFFWEKMGVANSEKINVTLMNVFEQNSPYKNIKCMVGDATNIDAIPPSEYDVVFSNSVIEHLFTFDKQRIMADNIKKLSSKYFVQTPNYNFPVEPHFLFPFFHYLPNRWKLYLLNKFSLGHYPIIPDKKSAQTSIDKIRLLKPREVKSLFPGSKLMFEKVLFFNKSIIVHNLN
jgi:hypothetical protein